MGLAVGYEIYGTIFDMLVLSAFLTVITVTRIVACRRRIQMSATGDAPFDPNPVWPEAPRAPVQMRPKRELFESPPRKPKTVGDYVFRLGLFAVCVAAGILLATTSSGATISWVVGAVIALAGGAGLVWSFSGLIHFLRASVKSSAVSHSVPLKAAFQAGSLWRDSLVSSLGLTGVVILPILAALSLDSLLPASPTRAVASHVIVAVLNAGMFAAVASFFRDRLRFGAGDCLLIGVIYAAASEIAFWSFLPFTTRGSVFFRAYLGAETTVIQYSLGFIAVAAFFAFKGMVGRRGFLLFSGICLAAEATKCLLPPAVEFDNLSQLAVFIPSLSLAVLLATLSERVSVARDAAVVVSSAVLAWFASLLISNTIALTGVDSRSPLYYLAYYLFPIAILQNVLTWPALVLARPCWRRMPAADT